MMPLGQGSPRQGAETQMGHVRRENGGRAEACGDRESRGMAGASEAGGVAAGLPSFRKSLAVPAAPCHLSSQSTLQDVGRI